MRVTTSLLTILMLSFGFSANTAIAKGGELKFNSIVIAVSQTDSNEGSIEVTIHDVAVSIIVNGDTEISESGEEVGLADVSAGDFVKVNSFFSDAGLVADEVEILDVGDEQFRFRGAITAIDTVAADPVITLLGVDVTINVDTDITQRGNGSGNSVAATDLSVGDLVNVSGSTKDSILVATRIHVGTREQGNIELEGEIVSFSDTEIAIVIEGGTTITLVVDGDTSIVGELEEGTFIEAEGQLLSDLSLIAFEIAVDSDGDGDADDDNQRGKRGDEHSNNGRGNGNDNGNGNSSDDDDSPASDEVEVGAETVLAADGLEIHGKVEFKFASDGVDIEQELEVELKDATSGTDYAILVFFGADSVDFGTFTVSDSGEIEVKFRSADSSEDVSLDSLLPADKDVRDITGVQILQDGGVVLEGDF